MNNVQTEVTQTTKNLWPSELFQMDVVLRSLMEDGHDWQWFKDLCEYGEYSPTEHLLPPRIGEKYKYTCSNPWVKDPHAIDRAIRNGVRLGFILINHEGMPQLTQIGRERATLVEKLTKDELSQYQEGEPLSTAEQERLFPLRSLILMAKVLTEIYIFEIEQINRCYLDGRGSNIGSLKSCRFLNQLHPSTYEHFAAIGNMTEAEVDQAYEDGKRLEFLKINSHSVFELTPAGRDYVRRLDPDIHSKIKILPIRSCS